MIIANEIILKFMFFIYYNRKIKKMFCIFKKKIILLKKWKKILLKKLKILTAV